MADKKAPLTEKIENAAASAKRAVDAHVAAQGERLEKHVEGAKARFEKLPGVSRDSDTQE
ncbi:MAG: hypothetical protein QM604_04555 [Microbacterium sp.]